LVAAIDFDPSALRDHRSAAVLAKLNLGRKAALLSPYSELTPFGAADDRCNARDIVPFPGEARYGETQMSFRGPLFAIAGVLVFAPAARAETTQVQILSAVVKDLKIVDATVIVQKNGAQAVSATTSDQGIAAPNPTFGDDENALLIVKKAGYSNLVVKCPCKGMTYALSPVMTALDGVRVVLNWGPSPRDLDLHVAFPDHHIYWSEKDGPKGTDARLDVDQTQGFGPETITIDKKHSNASYVFAVHDFTDRLNSSTSGLSNSGAKVLVYIGQSLVRSYYVPKSMSGNLWTIFRITEDGEFQDINTMRGTTVDAKDVLGEVNTFLSKETHVEVHEATASETRSATTSNRGGETAYHNGDLEGAANLFRQAIDIDSNFGQAYSNLRLTYQKLGRTSEAIWANRKAIALASGNTASTVRASSYYNIAKIYEAAGQFSDALTNYQLAKSQKENPVYTQAIERVRAQTH
jgi:uncharacterized protein YfaP (DUF2135 family)